MRNKVTQKIMESFKGMIPEDQASNVEQAISEFVEETEAKLKVEYEKTLEESYKEWDEQLKEARQEGEDKLKEAETTALEGYEEAKQLLVEKEEEITTQKSEFETFLNEQYEVAGNMLEEEKGKNETIEQNLYESYSQQIEDIKDDLINKIDSFLDGKVEEISVAVRKELKNSPEILENKVAFNRIKDIVARSLTTSELQDTASEKVEELEETAGELQKEIKALKAKNLRLTTENTNYQKEVKTITEGTNTESEEYFEAVRREAERRIVEKNAENIEGRGDIKEMTEEDILKENAVDEKEKKETIDESQKIDGFGYTKEDLLRMAGVHQ
jgi:hypothetical protein